MEENQASVSLTLNGKQVFVPEIMAQNSVESPVSNSCQINLPEVVGKLFMLDDTFFKSHFLREKLPPLLFSNGTNGFDRFFQDFDGPRVNREIFYEDDSDGPPTPTPFDNSGSSQRSVGSFGSFDGRNRQNQGKNGVVRNIPIKIEGHFQQQNFATTSEPQPAAYSQNYQTPYFASVSASIQTPNLNLNSNSFSVPIIQRQNSQPVIRKEEPDTISFRSIQFPSEERTGTFKRSQSSGRVSPPTPPQRRAFSYLLNQNQNQRPLSGEFQKQGERAVSPSPSVPSFRSDFSTTSMSQKSRPKSPSLQSLKNQFKKATNCVRKNQDLSDCSDVEQQKIKNLSSLSTPINQSQSSLHAPINKTKNSVPIKDDVNYDAVEEAIRSLESFDPNKILADATANWPSKISGSDSDSVSVVIHPNGKDRSSESPSSSGIVADINDELIIKSCASNRSSGTSSDNANHSSSDTEAGSYILTENASKNKYPGQPQSSYPIKIQGPQPPAVSRIAYPGNFAVPPQRAVVSTPSSSATSTLTKNETFHPPRNPSPPQVLLPLPSIVTHDLPESSEEDSATMRKRILCAQMTDCAKVIEINSIKMDQFTSVPHWRQAYMLQRNLPAIQDTVYIIEAALDELLEFTQRIFIVRGDPKHDEFIQLMAPLRTSQALIHRIRSNLDSTHWTLSALARNNGLMAPNDSLDQFVAVLQHLPKDCRKLCQWVYLLGNHGTTQFLPRHSPSAVPFPISTPIPEQMKDGYNAMRNVNRQIQKGKRDYRLDDCETKNSIKSLEKPIFDQKVPQQLQPRQLSKKIEIPQILSPISTLQPPTMEEICMDGGESTTSSTGSSVATDLANNSLKTPTIEEKIGEIIEEDDLTSIVDGKVYEEDDLMSVVSESSLYQDYSLVGENGTLPKLTRPKKIAQILPKISSNILKDLTEEEKELLKFYAPQLETHTFGLCKLIDEFFTIVEQNQDPTKFVQKIRLIILEAQTLVYIGDNMAQCVANPALRAEFRRACDDLNGLLTQCVTNARIAKDHYPNVTAVQTMMDSVVSVSNAAQCLKHIGKLCA